MIPTVSMIISAGLSVALLSTAARALTVPPGCAEPIISSVSHHSFYVDPEKGDKANDGSAEKPWRTLAEVLDPANHLVATKSYLNYTGGDRTISQVNPNGPIKPGDTIYLMSGHHGSPVVRQYVNDDFISIVAFANQVPIIDSLLVVGSSRWLFRGTKFQGVRPASQPFTPLINVAENGFFGINDNIIFIGNSISSTDDVKNWSDLDWVDKPYAVGLSSRAACTTIYGNHFFNLRNAVGIAGNNSIVEENLIDHIGNDGIDFSASNVTLRRNIIRDGHHTVAEKLHADGIQGWSIAGATNRSTIIDSNIIINDSRSDGNYMQGISIFDGKWDNLTIANNVVVTNTWHGIALYGVENALVINNTVVPSNPDRFATWITVHNSKDKSPSKNVIVRNNISAQLLASGDEVIIDHNIAQRTISLAYEEKKVHLNNGRDGSDNFIDPYIYLTLAKVDNGKGVYELRPKQNSRATGTGNIDRAPLVDITGKKRQPPIDIGAYAH